MTEPELWVYRILVASPDKLNRDPQYFSNPTHTAKYWAKIFRMHRDPTEKWKFGKRWLEILEMAGVPFTPEGHAELWAAMQAYTVKHPGQHMTASTDD